jgi:hypothetical protein
MLFAAIYLVTAGAGFWLLRVSIDWSAKRHVGLAYLRASLGLSFCLVTMDLLIRVIFGLWWVHPGLAVFLGFFIPAAVMAII